MRFRDVADGSRRRHFAPSSRRPCGGTTTTTVSPTSTSPCWADPTACTATAATAASRMSRPDSASPGPGRASRPGSGTSTTTGTWTSSFPVTPETAAGSASSPPATRAFPVRGSLLGSIASDGEGGFDDVAARSGLTRLQLPMGSNFGDLDHDGYPRLLPRHRLSRLRGRSCRTSSTGTWAGRRFVDVSLAAGFGHLQKGHAVAFADLDGDGDLDVFEQMGGAYPGDRFGDALFRNPGFGNRWLALRLVGTESNRSAIGARIRVDLVDPDGARRLVHRRLNGGGQLRRQPVAPDDRSGKADRHRAGHGVLAGDGCLAEPTPLSQPDRLYRPGRGPGRTLSRRLTGPDAQATSGSSASALQDAGRRTNNLNPGGLSGLLWGPDLTLAGDSVRMPRFLCPQSHRTDQGG